MEGNSIVYEFGEKGIIVKSGKDAYTSMFESIREKLEVLQDGNLGSKFNISLIVR